VLRSGGFAQYGSGCYAFLQLETLGLGENWNRHSFTKKMLESNWNHSDMNFLIIYEHEFYINFYNR
jgi:hypothetical protein